MKTSKRRKWKEGSSQLIQEKALIEYLRSGKNSVKLSNSSTTKAYGEGSVSIGHNSKVSKKWGFTITMGYNSGQLNSGSVSIGQGSNILGMNSIGIVKQ